MLWLPVLTLVALGVALPQLLARVLPEGVGWLLVNGAVAALALWLLASLLFAALYGMQETGLLSRLNERVWLPGYFALRGAQSALIWAPPMVLSVANLPRRWKTSTW